MERAVALLSHPSEEADMSDLDDLLRPHAKALENDVRFHGGKRAKMAEEVISLHQLHRACPSDPGAVGLCRAAFEEWQKVRKPIYRKPI